VYPFGQEKRQAQGKKAVQKAKAAHRKWRNSQRLYEKEKGEGKRLKKRQEQS
jgi:hypothetical protein